MNHAEFRELRSFKLLQLSLVTQHGIGQSFGVDEACHLAGINDKKNSEEYPG